MNISLRGVFTLILLAASFAFSLPATAAGEACIAPPGQPGYLVDSLHAHLWPVCSSVEVESPTDKEACVEPQGQPGYLLDSLHAHLWPVCVSPDVEIPVGCETIGPLVAQLGLSSYAGSSVAFAPACMTPLQIVTVPVSPLLVPEPLSCDTAQVDHPVNKRCP